MRAGEHRLSPRQVLFREAEPVSLWRVTHGVLRLDRLTPNGLVLVGLALPGDHVGVEALSGATGMASASALTDAAVAPAPPPASAEAWGKLLAQQQARAHDTMRLRQGTVQSRLRHFMQLLGDAVHVIDPASGGGGPPDVHALPVLRDLGEVLDAAPETVCHELARWRRQACSAQAQTLGAVIRRWA